MHNGAALYASNAGKAANADDAAKLDGLAPEAYIQPQESMFDNWYFADPVNQKLNKSYNAKSNTYAFDRWKYMCHTTAEGTLVLNDGSITVTTANNGSGRSWLTQTEEKPYGEIGDWETFALSGFSNSDNFYITLNIHNADIADIKGVGRFKLNPDNEQTYFINFQRPYKRCIYDIIFDIGSATVTKVKLEPGKYFTGWPVWNYALELAKCQRYYFNTINKENYAIVSSAAYARTNNRLQCVINSPVSMRTRPVPKIIGKIFVRRYNATHIKEISADIASIDCYSSLPWALSLDITLTDGTTPFVAGEYYNLIIETMSGSYLEFNANL